MHNHSFEELNLIEPIAKALKAEGYERPTPIQSQAIPHLLEGKDLIGTAQTGTGKTAAFAIPILQKLHLARKKAPHKSSRVLVLTPTRELAAQVGQSFKTYGRYLHLNHALVYGGVGQGPQVRALAHGVDILVATPGRLLDLMEQRCANLSGVEVFVLDEVDRMLDMGFLPDVKRIIASLPAKRQTLLFSATMAPEIVKLASGLLNDPVQVRVAPTASNTVAIDERVLFVDAPNKRALLAEILSASADTQRVIVFTKTKHGADRLVRELEKNKISSRAIHGDKTQGSRTAALEAFRAGRCRVLVATDIASRGIDVDGISHVINFDLPMEPEVYIHRIGRTARAGSSGIALSFCGSDEKSQLRDIERLLKRSVPVWKDHAYHSEAVEAQGNRTQNVAHRRKSFAFKTSRKRFGSGGRRGMR